MKINFSNFLGLNLSDLIKGAILAAITVAVGMLTTLIDGGHFPTGAEWSSIGKVTLIAFISYILKNLFTPPPATVVVDRNKTDVEYK